MKEFATKFRFLIIFGIVAGIIFAVPTENLGQKSRKISAKRNIKSVKTKAAAKKRNDKSIPWEGEAGVTKSMAELMLEQSKVTKVREIEIAEKEDRIPPDRTKLPQNSDSPFIEKFPVDPTTKAMKEIAPNIAPQAPQTLGLSFQGGTLFDTLSFPPDTMGEVGPSQYIMAVNGWVRSFNKTTGVADGVMNLDIDVFFNSVRNGISTSDPRIRYDRLSQRWIMAIINVADTDNRILIAVSNTANITPATVWTYYFFVNSAVSPAGDAGCFADYPSLGVDANALYIGTNNFCPSNFGGTTGFVVRKSSILNGGPIVATAFRGLVAGAGSGAGLYTPQGVDNFDPAATAGYFIGVDNATFGLLKLRRVSDPGGTPTISADINLTVPATQYAATVPHLGNSAGTTGNLDVLDDRLYMAYMRNGRIYTSHNIGVNAAGTAASNGRAGSRWYEIDNVATTPTLRQSGTWFDSAATNPKSFWIPSIMVSGQGHIALGGSSAGAADRINAATIGRLSSDPLGTLQTTLTYTNSTTAYNPAGDAGGASGRRFGDYSYTTIDPEDDMTIWTIQQWNHANNSYAMQVAKLLAPPPATPASATPATVNAGQSSVNVTITGTVVNGSGFFEPGPSFAKHIAASVSDGVTVNSVTYTSPTQITLNISTVGATAGAKNVTVTNPDGQAITGNALITVNSAPGAGNKIPSDFDGDGKTDISTFRNVSGAGTWYITNSSNNAFVGTSFGFGTDVIAPADYDGDNKTDVAVFRNGAWYLLRSSNGAFQAFNFGQAADKPTPGDFDGDGKADFAVFRPSNGTWYITQSSDNAFVARQFGANGDIPVFGRYDSDAKDDFAVYRGNTWYITQSTNNAFVAFQFGAAGDIPVAGDYDGDGKFDYAVFRPSNGSWYISQSSNGAFRGQQFGVNGDIPVPGNYDGDQKFDFAVFRAGTWYIQGNVSNAFSAATFGLATDKPIPSAYVQ